MAELGTARSCRRIAQRCRAGRADILIGDPGTTTGPVSWTGEQYLAGTELAVADLNARGGVLGEQIRLISVDDACDPEQAVAAACKLISDGVIFVVGQR